MQKNIEYLPLSCYNNNKANRILEYPGRQEAPDGSHIKGVGRFHLKWDLSALFVCWNLAYYGVKLGGKLWIQRI